MMMSFQVKQSQDGASFTPEGESCTPEQACRYLEEGGIIYFQQTPFAFTQEDKEFLLNQRQLEVGYHKNIAYRPLSDRLTGVKADTETDMERLKGIMRNYSQGVVHFLEDFLAPYAPHWRLDYASFRPVEEEGRKIRLRARNDLLHVDAFPTRPTYGDRILRVFTNIHPTKIRVWYTSDDFEQLFEQFIHQVKPLRKLTSKTQKLSILSKTFRILGLQQGRPPYDTWMLDFHNFLKENEHFQESTRKNTWEFPPNSSWMVYTDSVSHSVLSGQHALEQTFIIGHEGMVVPQKAPINLLERVYQLQSSQAQS